MQLFRVQAIVGPEFHQHSMAVSFKDLDEAKRFAASPDFLWHVGHVLFSSSDDGLPDDFGEPLFLSRHSRFISVLSIFNAQDELVAQSTRIPSVPHITWLEPIVEPAQRRAAKRTLDSLRQEAASATSQEATDRELLRAIYDLDGQLRIATPSPAEPVGAITTGPLVPPTSLT